MTRSKDFSLKLLTLDLFIPLLKSKFIGFICLLISVYLANTLGETMRTKKQQKNY